MANYLFNDQQCVLVAESMSSFVDIMKGVPQSSVLGHILFSIYIKCKISVAA